MRHVTVIVGAGVAAFLLAGLGGCPAVPGPLAGFRCLDDYDCESARCDPESGQCEHDASSPGDSDPPDSDSADGDDTEAGNEGDGGGEGEAGEPAGGEGEGEASGAGGEGEGEGEGDGGGEEDPPLTVDVDGDGLDDATVDRIIARGDTLCLRDEMIWWSSAAYACGYGFGGSNDWFSTDHVAYRDQGFHCFDFSPGLYRATMWSGPSGSPPNAWAALGAACSTEAPDPLCWEATSQQGSGFSLCFIVDTNGIRPASAVLCQGT